jgi:hypothetical protein
MLFFFFFINNICYNTSIDLNYNQITIAATNVAKPFLFFKSGDNLKASIFIKQQNERKVSNITPTTEMYSIYVLRKPAIY